MNDYKSLRESRTPRLLSIVLSVLVLLEVTSLALLFSRLTVWTPSETDNVFSLTEESRMTDVRVGRMQSDGIISFESTARATSSGMLLLGSSSSGNVLSLDNSTTSPETSITPETTSPKTVQAKPGFKVYDDNTVWSANTDVEIFRVRYENGSNNITVNTSDGDKLIAPGTSNKYSFTLKNTGNVSLDYQMTMQAYVTGTDLRIPVVVRVYDHEGEYCIGSENKWEKVLNLNEVAKFGTLASDRYMNYTLEWQWPFEGDDEYDTMLGNMAVEEDLVLTIVIKTLATQSEDPGDPGDNPPPTGDNTFMTFLCAAISVSIVFIIIINGKRRRDRSEEND